MRTHLALPIALLATACLNFGKVDDAKIPGELLGTYAVEGTLLESTCGEGALGSTDEWNFDVKLSRFHQDLYWLNGREVIPGTLDDDGVSFTFSTRVEGEVTPADRGRPPCVLRRTDEARGKLSSNTLDVEGFEATLTFGYSALEGSDCGEWTGSPEGVSALPCVMSYDLAGTRKPD